MKENKRMTTLYVQKTTIGINIQVEEIPEIDIINELSFTDNLEDEILNDTDLSKCNFNF